MASTHVRSRVASLASCLIMGASLASCGIAQEFTKCSEFVLAQTDRAAQKLWQVLEASEPEAGAYCDSLPHPFVGGSMNGPASELAARAIASMGCKETSVEGFDSTDSLLMACDIDGESYLLEIARQLDRFGGPGLEVGLYRR